MEEDNRYDGIFMSVLQQRTSINGFFESVFSFLRRQSDFFKDQKQAEKVIVEECKKQYDQFLIDQKNKEQAEIDKKLKEEEKLKKKQQQQTQPQQPIPKKEEQPVQVKEQPEQPKEVAQNSESKGDEEKKDDEPAPKGNGGRTDKYLWTQTLDELQIFIPIPSEIRSKNLNVNIGTETLLVQIKGQEPIINGKFYEKILADDSVWTITDGEVEDFHKGRYIHIQIEKWKGLMHWWDCAIQGDPKINTQKINPEPSKLNDLDGETRGTVEKMMFDMRQKQQGLPTSDELDKQNKLAEFMKAHPEMDFSKCKFN